MVARDQISGCQGPGGKQDHCKRGGGVYQIIRLGSRKDKIGNPNFVSWKLDTMVMTDIRTFNIGDQGIGGIWR